MPKPSVLRELQKRAEQATKLSKAKNQALIAALELCVPILTEYKETRKTYEKLLTEFGVEKYNSIVQKPTTLQTVDKPAFNKIIATGDRIEFLGSGDQGVVPAESTISRARKEFAAAKAAEVTAYAAITKYLEDKKTMKEMGEESYKEWKKGIRADLFKK